MTHADWPKTLEWVEKQCQESLKDRFTTAELISKEAQTTLTVLLAAIGGATAYAAKIFEPGAPGPLAIASAAVCVYLVALSVCLVMTCMMLTSYPALHQEPENLMQKEYPVDALKEAELKNIDLRIRDAAAINARRANWLNAVRIAAALAPIFFAGVAWIAPQAPTMPHEAIKLACRSAAPASDVQVLVTDCTIEK